MIATVASALWVVAIGSLEPATEPAALRWSAPSACANEAEVQGRVEAMLARGGSGNREAITLSMNVSPTDTGFRLVADMHGVDGPLGSRALEAVRCDDLVTAAVLIAAIAIDPELTPTPEPPPAAKPRPQVPLPHPLGPPPAAPKRIGDKPPPPLRPAPLDPMHGVFEVGLGVAFANLASPAPQASVEAGIERDAVRLVGRMMGVGPSFGRAPRGPAGGVFGLVAGGGAACFVSVPARWRGVGCLGSDLGVAFGRGRDTVVTPNRVRSLWWDARANVGAELRFSPRWSAAAHLDGGVVLAAPDFVIDGQGRVCCRRYVAGLRLGLVARWGG